LAQYSAMIAAASIISIKNGDVSEAEGYSFFEYIYRRAYTRMLVLVSHMYQKYNGKDEYFWSAQKLVHETTHHDQAVQDFTHISAGLTDLNEASRVDLRVLNEHLIREAEDAQSAKAATAKSNDLHSMDVTPTWGPWRSLVGPDTTMGEFSLVIEPSLGLRRVFAPVSATDS
jgi:hypothetical protein